MVKQIDIPAKYWPHIKEALLNFRTGFKSVLVSDESDFISVETGSSLMSCGEYISARKCGDNIRIKSKCTAQIIDWGVNNSNLKKIKDYLVVSGGS